MRQSRAKIPWRPWTQAGDPPNWRRKTHPPPPVRRRWSAPPAHKDLPYALRAALLKEAMRFGSGDKTATADRDGLDFAGGHQFVKLGASDADCRAKRVYTIGK